MTMTLQDSSLGFAGAVAFASFPSLYYQAVRNHVWIGIPICILTISPPLLRDLIIDKDTKISSKTDKFTYLLIAWITSSAAIVLGMACDKISSNHWISFVYQDLFLSILVLGVVTVAQLRSNKFREEINKACEERTNTRERSGESSSDPLASLLILPIFAVLSVLMWWGLDYLESWDQRLLLIAFMAFIALAFFVACCQAKGYGPKMAIYTLFTAAGSICLGFVGQALTSDRWERCLYHMAFAQILLISAEAIRIYLLFRNGQAGEWKKLNQIDLEQGDDDEVPNKEQEGLVPETGDSGLDTVAPPPYVEEA